MAAAALTTVTFSKIGSEPMQFIGPSRKEQVITLLFQQSSGGAGVSTEMTLTPTVSGSGSGPNMSQLTGIGTVTRCEVVEVPHKTSDSTAQVRAWVDVASGMPGTMWLGANPTADVDYTCKLRVSGF